VEWMHKDVVLSLEHNHEVETQPLHKWASFQSQNCLLKNT